MRRWKLSPMDLESITAGRTTRGQRTRCRAHRHPEAPWFVVDSADKRRARINMIAHLLGTLAYHDVHAGRWRCRHGRLAGLCGAPRESQTYVPDHAAEILAG